MKPQDILPDNQSSVQLAGITVRKGSVAAFMASTRTLADAQATPAEKEAARDDIAQLLPALDALGLFEVFSLRDPAVAAQVQSLRAGPAA